MAFKARCIRVMRSIFTPTYLQWQDEMEQKQHKKFKLEDVSEVQKRVARLIQAMREKAEHDLKCNEVEGLDEKQSVRNHFRQMNRQADINWERARSQFTTSKA